MIQVLLVIRFKPYSPFPLLSNGGTSMIGAWGLLAFVKAADTRQNASFAVRLNGRESE